jgi:pSer/pThr/pTyr-binding forkhead associated (FHA) protein
MPTSLTIGSRPDCDFVLRASTVSGRHCRLTRDTAGYLLEDLQSTNGTFFNGQRVLGSMPITLSPGDTIHLGSHPLSIDQILPLLEQEPAVTSNSASPLVIRGPETLIGRSQECDQVIDLPMVSSRHARIFRSGDRFLIEDLGSANGTFVNGNRIAGPVMVAAGDMIGLGSSRFVLDTGSVSQESPALAASSVMPTEPVTQVAPDQVPALSKSNESSEIASILSHPWPLAALLIQSPVLAFLIVGLTGDHSPAPVLFWLALAVLWFGLSSVMLSGLLDGRTFHLGLSQSGATRLLLRLTVGFSLTVLQCLLAWIIVARVAALDAPGLTTLVFLILTSVVGMALGLLIIALAPQPDAAWIGLSAVVLLLGLFGGIWPPPLHLPVIPSAIPSRWAFEGLLLLESGEDPGNDLAQAYFPADSLRMGLTADALALVFLLIGLVAACGLIVISAPRGPQELPASPAAHK